MFIAEGPVEIIKGDPESRESEESNSSLLTAARIQAAQLTQLLLHMNKK